ncbi:MAG: hypothetical protein ABWY12_03180 [Burkholderiales bacterium]
MALAFTFRLELEDGTPADPPTFRSSALTWKAGDKTGWARGRFARSAFETTMPTSRRR